MLNSSQNYSSSCTQILEEILSNFAGKLDPHLYISHDIEGGIRVGHKIFKTILSCRSEVGKFNFFGVFVMKLHDINPTLGAVLKYNIKLF